MFRCKLCNWKLPENSFHVTSDDIKEMIGHDKICPMRKNKNE